jgi:CP family cyanate transporter-like MFS transporter
VSTRPSRESSWVLLGVVALAVNLRPAAVSVGPVLEEIRDGLGMTHLQAGVLTSLPVVAFGVFGAAAPVAARKIGVHRLTLLALVALTAGLVVRAVSQQATTFLLVTLVALAGMAAANVVLPSLVKLHFPTRIGPLTSTYTTALAIGLTAASVLTVPIADATGSWRWGLAVWAVPAFLAVLPWVGLVAHDERPQEVRRTVPLRSIARTRIGWAMAVTFGLQSAQAYTIFGWFAQLYRDAGFSASTAGLLLGVITGVSIPVSLWVPAAAARREDQTRLLLLLLACYPVGYLGLLLAPVAGAWLWAVLVGIGTGVFPLVLTMIALRTRTSDGTAALSGFSQAVGYAISIAGPLGISIAYDATGGWTLPLLLLTGASVATALVGMRVSRPGHVEDELPA